MIDTVKKQPKRGIVFVLALLLGSMLFGLLGVVFIVWRIDRTWTPLLEPRLQERQQVGSVRVLAKDTDGKDRWIGSLTAGRMEERQPLKLSEVPPLLVQAIVVLEDPRFLQHGGFDVLGIIRALVRNLITFRYSQGGSTITQQLVKNVFLTQEKTIKRKVTELILAALVEKRFSKDQILEAYMNEVYLGQLGSVEIHGVGRAAEYYFGKKVDQLDIHEIALLAAVIASPHVYSPRKHPEKTKARRNRVLRALADSKLILPEEFDESSAKPLPGPSEYIAPTRAAYLMDALRERLLEERGELDVLKGGFDVHLGLDLELQEIAEKTLANSSVNWELPQQAAIVAADPRTCDIKIYAGGTEYRLTQLDRIRQSRRPIGSLMKPLEVARLLETDKSVSLATQLSDSPLEWIYNNGRSTWKPANFDNKFRGLVSLRRSLEESLNVPIVRLFYEKEPAGILTDILDPVRGLGLDIPAQRALPSAVLGAIEQTPLTTLYAYVKLARQALGLADDAGDFACRLHFDEKPVDLVASDEKNSFNQQGARLTLSALEGALRRGTSASLGKKLPLNQAWAGKTGTSSDRRDAWYVALSPELVVLGWIGRDDNKETQFTGATGAMPIVARVVEAMAKRPAYAHGWSWPQLKSLSWQLVDAKDICRPSDISGTRAASANPPPTLQSVPPEPFAYDNKTYYYDLFREEAPAAECGKR